MTFDLSFLANLPYVGIVFSHIPQILSVAASLVAAASAIAAVVPHPASVDSWLARIRQVVDWLALNVGHSTPASAMPPVSGQTTTDAKPGA